MKHKNSRIFSPASLVVVALALSTSIQGASALDSAQVMSNVKIELDTGKVSEKSLNEMQAVVQAEPTNSEAHLLMGLVLDQVGLLEPASEQFQLAIKYGTGTSEELVALCKRQISMGRVGPAIAILDQGMVKYPNNAEMMFIIGKYLVTMKKLNEARALLDKAYQLDPKIPGLATALAQMSFAFSPAHSRFLADEELQRAPKSEEAHYVRGISNMKIGNFQEAKDDLEFVFEKSPAHPVVTESLAEVYYWLGQYEKAVAPAMYLTAITSHADVERAGSVSQLVSIFRKVNRDRLPAVVAATQKDIEAKKLATSAFYYSVGKAFDQVDMPHSAMAEYTKAIAADSNNARAYYRLGLDQELHLRDYTGALESYKAANNLRPGDHELTVAYLRLEDRYSNRNGDIAWRFKNWLHSIFSTFN